MKKILSITFLVCAVIVFTMGACPVVCKGCIDIEITEDKGLYIIRIPKERNSRVYPYVTKFLTYNKDVFAQTNAELVINAGYFDPKNHGTTSYVIIDGKTVLDPTENKNLMNNQALSPYLDKILNRTEFRVYSCQNGVRYDITAHNTKPPFGCSVVHSIQAGPMLYPDLKLSREYFVTKDENGNVTRDSITALKKCARTAIGLKDGDIYIIIANIYHKLTLVELHKICEKLCLEKAMNFDGGGSTSLNFKGTNNTKFRNLEITSDKDKNARKLKSFLVIE